VRKLARTFLTILAMSLPCRAPAQSAPAADARPFPSGTVLPNVVTTARPDQSYALFLPSGYTPKKKWPTVYAFDPGAQGARPVELMKDAAEQYGFIVLGSNNSRNGSWSIEGEAAQAMLQDSQQRFSVDSDRLYFAGFSGGARVAARVAQLCKCAAAVLLNGAGFHPEAASVPQTKFAVFSAVGNYDFNYGEVAEMDDELGKFGYPHFLRRFDGPHQWAPATVQQEALAWFRVQAMKQGGEPRDPSLINALHAQELERARALESSGDLFLAWKEYAQAARMFAGLADITGIRDRADALAGEKAVRDGAKREKQEFAEQDQVAGEISSGLSAIPQSYEGREDLRAAVEQKILALRSRLEHEKQERTLRVLKRARAGVLVQSMEMGFERMEQKDFSLAREFFELACAADPDSVWALGNLAAARASAGDRKGALSALRQAKLKTKDPVQFSSWLSQEAAFDKLRNTPEFQALLEPPPQH